MSETETKFWKCPTNAACTDKAASSVEGLGSEDFSATFGLGFTSGVRRACEWCEANLTGSGDKAAVAASVVGALASKTRSSDEEVAYWTALQYVREALT